MSTLLTSVLTVLIFSLFKVASTVNIRIVCASTSVPKCSVTARVKKRFTVTCAEVERSEIRRFTCLWSNSMV